MQSNTLILNTDPVDFDPFAGPEIVLFAPATEPQVEIWTSCLIGGPDASCAYNESASLLLTGTFDKGAMYKALQALLDRHEALRTVFSADGKDLCVYKNPEVVIDYHDLSLQDSNQHKQFIKNHSRQAAITPFDLINGPLFKVSLFKLSNTAHHITLNAHHIICDGWSVGVMMQELSKLYSAFAQNNTPDLPAAPCYSQYAIEQAALTTQPEYQETEEFWINQFKGSDHLLNMPADHSRPAFRTYKSNRLDFTLDAILIDNIKAMGRKAGASFVTTLLAATEVYLQQITGQDEIILGLPAAGQAATGNYGLIGHCVNLLALRSMPKREQSFLEYLKERKSNILDAYDHQLYTFGTLLKKLNIPRDASRLPLVPVVFNIDTGMDDGVNFYNLKHKYFSNPREYETFELFLNIADIDGGMIMEWSYNTYLFEAATINRMMDEFDHLLRHLVKSPETLIGKIPVLKNTEILEQLKAWNNTKVSYPKEKPLHQAISETAKKFPASVALKHNSEKLTYQQLNQQANKLAAVLIANGVRTGNKVAVLLDRSPQLVITLLAIMKAGGVYVPLDPQFPVNRINYMLNDCGAALLLTSGSYKGQYASAAKELLIEQAWQLLKDHPDTDPDIKVTGNDLIYILYTSGSTGQPKGVQIAHHNVVNLLYSMQKAPGLNASDKLLAVTTISFDIAGLELFLPLITGAQIVMAGSAAAKDGYTLLDIINEEKITVMQATPYTWRILLEAGWKNEKIKVICGGEALPADLASAILKRTDSLWNVYGPTETTIWSSIKQITETNRVINIGKPIDNTGIYVLDDFLNPMAPGVTGEIYITGEGLSKGYLNQPELTNEKFVPDPFSELEGARMYRTGDLGTFTPEGELQYISRVDAQIKIRGFRIEAGEIEFYLGRISNIKQAVVMARADHNGINKLIAFITLSQKSDQPEQATAWRNELKKQVPDYMVPDNFFVIPEMPLTPNGKVDKKALSLLEISSTEVADNYVAPRTDVEKLIAAIWKECLGIKKIGITDNFFEMGGHSLIAVKVMARIKKETGKQLPLAMLFENSTVEKLAPLLQIDESTITWDSLVPVKPGGNKPPLYIVHSAGLNTSLINAAKNYTDAGQPVYGIQAKGLNGFDEPLSIVEDIAAHHIASIRVQNPDGPYALAGYSFGGLVAFEMARQLKELNKEVSMLAMIDTYAYRTPHYDPWLLKQFKRGKYFFRRLLHALFTERSKDNNRFAALKRVFTRKLWKLKYVENQQQNKFFGYANKIDEMNETAQKHYRLQPIDVVIELFRAQEHSFYMDDFEYMGWKPYAKKGVNVHKIPGEHSTLFMAPNDKLFIGMLQECLNTANNI